MCDHRDVFQVDRLAHRRDQVLEIATQCGLTAGEGHHHRIEELRCVCEALELMILRFRRCLPVVTEPTACVAPHRDFEVHEDWAPACREPRILRKEERNVIWLEAGRKHKCSGTGNRGRSSGTACLTIVRSRTGGSKTLHCRVPVPWPRFPFNGLRVSIIGSWISSRAAVSIARSYPASAWRATPMPGSFVSTRSSRTRISGVPSATI